MSLNKVQLIGNAVAAFPLATTERGYTLANGTQVPEQTEWHNIVLWRGLAEVADKYVHKGDKLYIEGKIRSRSYADSKGIQRYRYEIFADNMEILSSKQVTQPTPNVTPTQQASTTQATQVKEPKDNDSSNDLPF